MLTKVLVKADNNSESCIVCGSSDGRKNYYPIFENGKMINKRICTACLSDSEHDEKYGECLICNTDGEEIAYSIENGDLILSDYNGKYYCKDHHDPNGGEPLTDDEEDFIESFD
jgi:RNA polymerase subunit RPABC4/transcription elongation factor Spt4